MKKQEKKNTEISNKTQEKVEMPKVEPQKNYKTYYLVAGIAVILLIGFFMVNQDAPQQATNTDTQPQNLDEVVATVNDRDITQEDVQRTRSILLAQTGQQISDEAALERAINEKLMLQAAENENIVITTQEAEVKLQELAGERGVSMQELKDKSDEIGSNYDEELEIYRQQLIIGELLETGLPTTEVTTEEAKGFYEANKETLFRDGNIQPFEEVEEELKAGLSQQKFQSTMTTYLSDLRSNAEIEYLN